MNNTNNQGVSRLYLILTAVFCTCLITANLLETKVVQIGSVTFTAGFIVFPVSYIINDIATEVYGFKGAKTMIYLGFAMNFLVLVFSQIAIMLPAAPFWDGADAFRFVFGLAPRIAVASLLAFLTGSLANAYVMSRMKVKNQKRFSLRAIVSTIAGEGLDSLVFFPIAFLGTMSGEELLKLMLLQVCGKTLYEVVMLPVTSRVVAYTKRKENLDTIDSNENYKLF
ncbi:MAG: queuosine precursor transporter [Paludibacteraceae bacterium]|nr:queuosine precursor transporter [Paludibacteraceae bacterium]